MSGPLPGTELLDWGICCASLARTCRICLQSDSFSGAAAAVWHTYHLRQNHKQTKVGVLLEFVEVDKSLVLSSIFNHGTAFLNIHPMNWSHEIGVNGLCMIQPSHWEEEQQLESGDITEERRHNLVH